MPYHALSFADMTVFARTDITSSMMRFVERGHSEACINRPIYVLSTFLLAIHPFCAKHAFFSPIPFQHITFIGILARQNEIVLPATFNPGFGCIQLQSPIFCLIHLMKILNAFLVHIIPLFDNNLIDGKSFFDIVCDSAYKKAHLSRKLPPSSVFITRRLPGSVCFDCLCPRNDHAKFHEFFQICSQLLLCHSTIVRY